MKVTVENLSQAERRLHITVPVEAVDEAFNSIYEILQKKLVVPGFRPGKAPLNMVKKYKSEQTAQEATRSLLDKYLSQALTSTAVNTVGRPLVENQDLAEQGKEYVISVLVEVSPDIALGELHKGMVVNFQEFSLDDKQIDDVILRLARKQSKYEPVETAAEKGMVAIVDVHPKGHAHLGGHEHHHDHGHEHHHSHGQELFLDETSDSAELKKAVVGMKSGETKEVSIGEGESKSDLVVSVSAVYSCDQHPVDDTLAKSIGLENLDQLRDFVKSSLNMRLEYENKNRLESALLDTYLQKIDVSIPPKLLSEVIESTKQSMQVDERAEQAKDKAAYQDLLKGIEEHSKKLIKTELTLNAAVKAFDLSASEDEIKQKEEAERRMLAQEKKNRQQSGRRPSSRREIERGILFEKFVGFLQNNASIIKTQTQSQVPFPFPW